MISSSTRGIDCAVSFAFVKILLLRRYRICDMCKAENVFVGGAGKRVKRGCFHFHSQYALGACCGDCFFRFSKRRIGSPTRPDIGGQLLVSQSTHCRLDDMGISLCKGIRCHVMIAGALSTQRAVHRDSRRRSSHEGAAREFNAVMFSPIRYSPAPISESMRVL